MDNKIQEDMLPLLGCTPPWLSTNNQCNQIVSSSGFNQEKFYLKYALPAYSLQKLRIEDSCKRPCLATRATAQLRNQDDHGAYNGSWVKVYFKKEVVVIKHMSGYTYFQVSLNNI